MSALGQKQTCAAQKVMSTFLPPKADMCSALVHVRFVPRADIACYSRPALCMPSRNLAIGSGV